MGASRFSRLAVMIPWLACLALLGWIVYFGAQNSGPLVGRVLDETGAPVPGATITITADDGVSVQMVSDHQGWFRIPDFRVGRYQIRAELAGFRTLTDDVDLQRGWTARLAKGAANVVLRLERSPSLPPRRLLTLVRPQGGTVIGEGIQCGTLGSDCAMEYPQGKVVVLQAFADQDFTFRGFTGDCVTRAGQATGEFQMSSARRCGATFAPIRRAAASPGETPAAPGPRPSDPAAPRPTTPAPAASADPPAGITSVRLQLPAFPWPPPTPSARFGLQRSLFGSASSQFAVAEQLTSALDGSGYSEYCFYWAPGGFALVARLERMREDGTAAPEALRFLSPGSTEPFSLDAYIRRLFFAPAGLYRQIIFVATDQPFTTDTSVTLTAEEAARLLRRGANRLPDAYGAFPFGPSHSVAALIYEFRKGPDDRDVVTLDPGRLAGRTHLERAGILGALQRQGGR